MEGRFKTKGGQEGGGETRTGRNDLSFLGALRRRKSIHFGSSIRQKKSGEMGANCY